MNVQPMNARAARSRGAASAWGALALVCGLLGSAWGHEGSHDHSAHEHAANDNSATASALKDSVARYQVPDVWLVRDDGRRVRLQDELQDARPVLLNFVYTTCPGICPMMSAVFSQVQEALGPERDQVRMVSISIDPEQDTVPRLQAYAQRFDAGPQWHHYTGTVQASVQVQKAFKAYGGDKMNHEALTLLRPASGACWLRVDGFANAQDVLGRLRAWRGASESACGPVAWNR